MRALAFATILIGFAAAVGCGTPGGGEPFAAAPAVLPADIDPVSYSRLPLVKREDLDEYGQQVFDMIGAGDREPDDPLRGPAAISLYSPHVAEGMHLINQAVRFNGVLGRRNSEIAILVAAREMDQHYEWSGHENAARNFGVDEAVIDMIKNDLDIMGVSEPDAVIVRFGRQLFRNHSLDPDTWARAVELFGQQGALELAATMGDYAMAAIMLNAVDHHLPPGREDTLPVR